MRPINPRNFVVIAALVASLGGGNATARAETAVVHDAVVVPVKPLRVRIPVRKSAVVKRTYVKVINADAEGSQTIRLAAESIDCPGVALASPPDFGGAAAGTSDSVSLLAGRSAVAQLLLIVTAQEFEPSSPLDPHRCSVALTASTVDAEGATEPTPANNVATLEFDVRRPGGTAQAGDGWAVRSVKPVTVTLTRGAAGATTGVAVRITNVDAALGPRDPGQALLVTVSDGDCPPGTVGAPDFERSFPGAQVSRYVAPQRTAMATVPVTVDLGMLALGRPNAPARCSALIRVQGTVDHTDRDASNDVTRLVVSLAGSIDPGGPASAIQIVTPLDHSQAPASGSIPVVIRLSQDVRPSPRVVLWTGVPARVSDLSARFTVLGDSAVGDLTPSDLVPGLSVLAVSARSTSDSAVPSASVLFSWEPAIDASLADRCDFLGQSRCLLPFPNDWFTVSDGVTDTGRRVHFVEASMPANVSGVHVDPTEWNRNDGFSPATPILAHLPGVDLARSGAAPITDIGRSLDGDPIVLLDADTGDRHPYFAELDATATSDAGRALIIRPARNLTEGHRYVVAFRRLADTSGFYIPPSRAFVVYRDRVPTFLPAVEGRREHLERVFADLAAAGIARDDLQLAWDFTVASERNLSERLLHIRDDAFAALGDAVPVFTVTSVEDAADEYVYRRIRGTYEVPLYLTGTGAAGSTFHYAPGARPDALPQRNGTFTAEFACFVPRSTTADGNDPVTPGRPMLDGHGLFQDIPEYLYRPRVLANEHNIVQCMSNWIGQTSEDIPQIQLALGDASLSATIYDRAQQGVLNYLFLGRLMKDARGFASQPAFRAGASDTAVLEPGELYYLGGSQVATLGGVATAMATDWTRAVFVVPPMNFSLLETRSVHWHTYGPYRDAAYTDELDRALLFAIAQMLQDRAEPSGYAAHIISDPYPGTPLHEVLLVEAFGDYQVANIATENEARSLGVHVWQPFLAPGRSPDLTPAWGLPAVPAAPFHGSVLVMWDFGRPAPPTENLAPPWSGSDPHGGPGSDPRARQMMSDFLQPNGAFVDVCNGGPCQSDVLD